MLLRFGRLLRLVGRDLLTLLYALRHSGTPLYVKGAIVLLSLYVLSPVDLVPDWLPVVGWLDDVTLIAFLVPALLKLVPQPALHEARSSMEGFLARMRFRSSRS